MIPLFINPYCISFKDEQNIQLDEKITEIIETLLQKKPGAVLEASQDPKALLEDIQMVINELGCAYIEPQQVLQNLLGYGPLQRYIEDPDVTDIFITSPDFVAVRKNGKDEKVDITFRDIKHLKEYIKRVVVINGGRINENEAKVVVSDPKYQLRIVATLESISIGSPSLHIRKPPTHKTLNQLVAMGMLDENTATFLRELVRNRKSIVISGAPSSGKTTLLAALIREIPEHERYAIIQETYEIPKVHPNSLVEVIRTSELQPWLKQYTLFELTKLGLLETLNRIIIGEIKGKETYEWVFAVYSGMNGSMTTVHTNSAEETIPKLIMLMKLANTDLPESFLRDVLKSAIDYVVFMKSFKLQQIYDVKKGVVRYVTETV